MLFARGNRCHRKSRRRSNRDLPDPLPSLISHAAMATMLSEEARMQKPHSAMAPVIQQVAGPAGTLFLARIAAKHFARAVGMPGAVLARRDADDDGYFAFTLSIPGE